MIDPAASHNDPAHGDPWGTWKARFYALTHRRSASNLWVVDHADLRSTDRVLDVGCGPGVALCAASAQVASIAGVDPTPGLVKVAARRCRRRANVDVREAEASRLPFLPNSFTVVWAIASLHHWPDRPGGLAEVHRVLRDGGRILIAEWVTEEDHGHGLSEDETTEVTAELHDLGFGEVSIETTAIRRETMVVIRAVK